MQNCKKNYAEFIKLTEDYCFIIFADKQNLSLSLQQNKFHDVKVLSCIMFFKINQLFFSFYMKSMFKINKKKYYTINQEDDVEHIYDQTFLCLPEN